jgi:hypothetical protein
VRARPTTDDGRSSPFGNRFLLAFLERRRALTFDDLAHVAGGRARYSDVVGWISRALTAGLVQDAGYDVDARGHPTGPRRYVLTDAGRIRATMDRRRRRL